MEQIKDSINKARTLRPTTLKTYTTNLNKLHKKMFDNEPLTSLDFLLKYEKVVDTLADLKLSTQKTYIAGIVVALSASKENKYEKILVKYREIMINNIKSYDEEVKLQKKSETQNENWVSMKALKKVINNYKSELERQGIFKKETLNKKERDLLQKWLVGSLYIIDTGNPPLRNDYTPMEVITLTNYNKLPKSDVENNNYLVNQSRNKKWFSFGEYKTRKTYGIKKINLGKKLNAVMNIYLKFHKDKNLLLNNRGEALSSNGLTKYIQKVFSPTGKVISANLLRHIYISEYLTGPSLQDKQALGEKMGHNVNTQELYKKN
tara:strand:- start:519 stop:1478 length:960 start_codon:yes stop_codon:yes gene_type:complete